MPTLSNAPSTRLYAGTRHYAQLFTEGLLLRARLLRITDGKHALLLTMHHIISDGWSMGVFATELLSLYRAYSRQQPSSLPDLPIQSADFALWQRQQLQGETLERLLGYWRHQLAGSPSLLQLPTDHPRPAAQTFRGGRYSFLLSSQLTAQLKALSEQEDATLFMTLLAIFLVQLTRYTAQEDLVVGTPIANRTRAEIQNLIGFFVNTLVLRTNLAGNPTFRELLAQVCAVALEAYAHQELPFEQLVEALHHERSLSYNPLI